MCPECNKKIKRRRYLKGVCKCGYVLKFSDYTREPCTYTIICNGGDDCWDDDWKNCGIYIKIKELFNGNV